MAQPRFLTILVPNHLSIWFGIVASGFFEKKNGLFFWLSAIV
jgi:hypothetical protein